MTPEQDGLAMLAAFVVAGYGPMVVEKIRYELRRRREPIRPYAESGMVDTMRLPRRPK